MLLTFLMTAVHVLYQWEMDKSVESVIVVLWVYRQSIAFCET